MWTDWAREKSQIHDPHEHVTEYLLSDMIYKPDN